MRLARVPFAALTILVALTLAVPALAGFAATELFVPGVARIGGVPPSQWYSTLWITNPSDTASVDVDVQYLLRGQANPSPQGATFTLEAGETRRFENVIETLLSRSGTSGALRILANGEVIAGSRTYDMPTGSTLRDSKGHYFGGLPTAMAIGEGQTSVLIGVMQGGQEDFRTNFGVVETAGHDVTVRFTLRDEVGGVKSRDYTFRPFEPWQENVNNFFGAVATDNSRLTATVLSGEGRVILYSTLIPNGSQDSAGFEMVFPADALAADSATSTKGVAADATSTVVAAVDKAYTMAATIVLQGSYDDATGWWTLDLTLRTGQTAHLQVQFKDGSGAVQKFYNPLTTNSMQVKGSAEGPLGSATYDLTVTGVNTGAASLGVTGSGSAVYEGTYGTFVVSGLTIPKSAGAYPTAGTVTVEVGGVTVTVTFNGTQFAHGSYTMGRVSVPFTINLETGEVTPA